MALAIERSVDRGTDRMLPFNEFLGDCDIPSNVSLQNVSVLFPHTAELRKYHVYLRLAEGPPRSYHILGEVELPFPEWDCDTVLGNICGRYPDIAYLVEWV